MLVQERSTPKSPKGQKGQNRTLPTLHPNRFSEAKSLDFSTWVSENLYKIITILLLVATVAALFFLRNVGDTAALLCFETQSKNLEKIELPQVNWNSIATITDKSSPYANFRTERWIVVSVSDYPTDSLRNLVKIRGWQVLAIGNSRTPSDWSLKGQSTVDRPGLTIYNIMEAGSHLDLISLLQKLSSWNDFPRRQLLGSGQWRREN